MTVDEHTPLLRGSADTDNDSANPPLPADADVVRDEVDGTKPKVSMLKIVRSATMFLCRLEFDLLWFVFSNSSMNGHLDVTAFDRYLPLSSRLDDCSFILCCYRQRNGCASIHKLGCHGLYAQYHQLPVRFSWCEAIDRTSITNHWIIDHSMERFVRITRSRPVTHNGSVFPLSYFSSLAISSVARYVCSLRIRCLQSVAYYVEWPEILLSWSLQELSLVLAVEGLQRQC